MIPAREAVSMAKGSDKPRKAFSRYILCSGTEEKLRRHWMVRAAAFRRTIGMLACVGQSLKLSNAEIAKHLGLCVGTVKVCMLRARQ